MTTVVMPQLGESVMEGTVVRWIAKTGQKVERDEPLVEIATEKANTEIPPPTTGGPGRGGERIRDVRSEGRGHAGGAHRIQSGASGVLQLRAGARGRCERR